MRNYHTTVNVNCTMTRSRQSLNVYVLYVFFTTLINYLHDHNCLLYYYLQLIAIHNIYFAVLYLTVNFCYFFINRIFFSINLQLK